MKVTINGELREVTSRTLADLLQEVGYGSIVVATAVNEEFVPVSARAQRELSAGDVIEVLSPMQGG
jgi:sulfur carrier protein